MIDLTSETVRAQDTNTSADCLHALVKQLMPLVKNADKDDKAAIRGVLRLIAKHPNTGLKTLRWLAWQSAIKPFVHENPNYTIAILVKQED